MTSVFISYSWDSPSHKAWVARLAVALRARGVKVKLDQDDLRPGADLTKYMETAVRESDRVLLICTPGFAKRADSRRGGVGYEQAIVTGEIFSGVAHPEKFVPVLRGDPQFAVPSFLRNRVWVDCRDDSQMDQVLDELIGAIHAGLSESESSSGRKAELDEDLQVYQEAVAFSRSKEGFGATKAWAMEFAEQCQESWSLSDFRTFASAFIFARTAMKFSRAEAEVFAADWMERPDHDRLSIYQRAFEFARARDGLHLGVERATDFLEEFDQSHGLDYVDRFIQAFQVARSTGKCRADAEDYALEQL